MDKSRDSIFVKCDESRTFVRADPDMAFDSGANHQDRNVPIQSDGIVPKYELVHTYFLWKHISKKKIEELAIQKYKTCGNDSKHEEGGRING
ncbi:MAG: hypothetical protein WAM14_01030 [Candidatus Nitrosopolaris sp.]